MARDLITTPAEDLGPQHMVAEARALVAAHPGATIRVVEGEELLVQVCVGGGERGAVVGDQGDRVCAEAWVHVAAPANTAALILH